MRKLLLLLGCLGCLSFSGFGQTGNYRTITTGDWNNVNTWERDSDSNGSYETSPADVVPTSATSIIDIQAGHVVTVPSGFTASAGVINIANNISSSLVIDAGGQLNLSGALSLGTAGARGRLEVSGILRMDNSSTISNDDVQRLIIFSGGTYRLNYTTAGVIYDGDFQSGSTLEFTGYTSVTATAPTLPSAPKTFHHVTWNCTSQGNDINLNGILTDIAGNFSVLSTSSSSWFLYLTQNSATTLSIGGNFQVSNSSIVYLSGGSGTNTVTLQGNLGIGATTSAFGLIFSGGSGSTTMTVKGNVSVTQGFINLAEGSGTGTLDAERDFSLTAGVLKKTNASGTGNLNFKTNTVHAYTYTGTAVNTRVNYTVFTGSTLVLGTNNLTGTGTFSIQSGASLRVGSADGLTTGSTLGNIRVTGTRTYTAGSNISYNGTIGQNLGSEWGSGGALNGVAVNLEINNSSVAGVTNDVIGSTSVVGILTLTQGSLNIGTANTLQIQGIYNGNGGTIGGDLTSSLTFSGSGAINGNLAFKTGTEFLNNFTISRTAVGGNPVNLTSNLEVAGTLSFASDVNLRFNGVTLTVSGDITQGGSGGLTRTTGSSNLVISGGGSLTALPFVGAPQLNNVTIGKSATWNTAASVAGTLTLSGGTLTHSSGLTMIGGATIVRNGGTTYSGSSPSATGPYDVTYTGGTITSGNELPSNTTDLRNLTVGSNVTLNKNITINGDVSVTSGTLDASTFNITMAGATFAVTGGSFTMNSASTFTFSRAGTTAVTGSSLQFPNLTISSGATVTAPASMSVSGTWDNNGAFTPGSGTVTFNGGAAQGIDPAGQPFNNVVFATTSSTKTLSSNLDVNGTLTINSGVTLDVGGNNQINVAGTWSNSGTFNANGGLVVFDGAGQTITSAGQSFNHLQLSGSGTKVLGSAIDINGNLTIDASVTFDPSATAYNINIAGNWTNNGTYFTPTRANLVTFDGNTTIGGSSTTNFFSVTIAGTLTASSGTTDIGGTWLYSSGTFNANGGTVRFNGSTQSITSGGQSFNNVTIAGTNTKTFVGNSDINGNLLLNSGTLSLGSTTVALAGNFDASGGGVLNAGTSSVNFDGAGQSITSGGESFNAVQLLGSGTKSLADNFDANATLTLTRPLNAGSNNLNIGGNFSASLGGGLTSSTGTTTFDGGTQSITTNGGSFGNLTVNASGTKTLQDNCDVNGNLTVSTGTLDVSASNFALTVGGNWDTETGGFNARSGTVTLDGGANTITMGGDPFNNLTLSGSGAKALQNDLIIGANLSISGGTLDAGNFTPTGLSITIGGNWTTSVTSAFTAGTSTVTFAGAAPQSISGSSMSFNNINANTASGVGINTTVRLDGVLTLNATGVFDADGGGGGVFIISSTSTTAGGRIAALPVPANFSGVVTIERFIHGASGGDYRYISMPVTGPLATLLPWKNAFGVTGNFSDRSTNADFSNIVDTGNTRPSVFTWNSTTQAYVAVDGSGGSVSGTTIDSRTGYVAYDFSDVAVTPSYSGPIESGNIPLAISGTNNNMNLVPNPYPSPIDWDNVTKTNVNNALWLRIGNNSFASGSGGVYTNGPGGWGGEIATGQSFWVQSNGGGSTLTLKEADKTVASTTFLRTQSVTGYFKMKLKSSSQEDEIAIRFVDGATDKLDGEYDAIKRKNGNYVSVLGQYTYLNLSSYLSVPASDFAINTIGTLTKDDLSKVIKLNVADVTPGNHSLTFSDFGAMTLYRIYLEDHFLSKEYVVGDNFVYNFAVSSNTASFGDSRFSLRFEHVDLITAIGDQPELMTTAYPNPVVDKLYVKLSTADEAALTAITLIDVMGRPVISSDKNSSLLEPGIKTIDMTDQSSGFYLLNIHTGNMVKTIKVIKK